MVTLVNNLKLILELSVRLKKKLPHDKKSISDFEYLQLEIDEAGECFKNALTSNRILYKIDPCFSCPNLTISFLKGHTKQDFLEYYSAYFKNQIFEELADIFIIAIRNIELYKVKRLLDLAKENKRHNNNCISFFYKEDFLNQPFFNVMYSLINYCYRNNIDIVSNALLKLKYNYLNLNIEFKYGV